MMTITTETQPYAFTTDDTKAVKDARYVVLFFRPDGSEGPTWGMRVGTEVRLDDDGAERKLVRVVQSGLWTRTYADENSVSFVRVMAADEKYCSGVLYESGTIREAVWLDSGSFRLHEHVLTALKAIRPGDSIGILFQGSNNCENDRRVNHHRDECYLRIVRKDKLIGVYLMGVMVGPDNLARMVKS